MSIFDTYICKEPAGDVPLLMQNGPDEYTRLLRTLQRSAEYFTDLNQTRVVERINYEQARLHMNYQNWKHAMRILLPLWQNLSWRRSGWWMLLREVDLALQQCAKHVNDPEVLISLQWELLNSSLDVTKEMHVDLKNAVGCLPTLDTRPRVKLKADDILSPINASVAFASSIGNVGLPLSLQLSLRLCSNDETYRSRLQRAQLMFKGGSKSIWIDHESFPEDRRQNAPIELQKLYLDKSPQYLDRDETIFAEPKSNNVLSGTADLTLTAGCHKILCIEFTPREAGELSVNNLTLLFAGEQFDVSLDITNVEHLQHDQIFSIVEGVGRQTKSTKNCKTRIQILPKPPKVSLRMQDPSRDLFTDETLLCPVEVQNDEDEEIDVRLDMELHNLSDIAPIVQWHTSLDEDATRSDTTCSQAKEFKDIGSLLPSESNTHVVAIEAPSQETECNLVINARYHLKSDPDSQLRKSLRKQLSIRQPFDSVHEFTPLLHPDPWPSIFVLGGKGGNEKPQDTPSHISQQFLLSSKLLSVSSYEHMIQDVQVIIQNDQDGMTCVVKPRGRVSPLTLHPGQFEEYQFMVDVQRLDVDIQTSSILDLQLKIRWFAPGTEEAMVAYHPVQTLTIPFGEPRILACARKSQNSTSDCSVSYWIENPSAYSLTFSIMMETSDDFAFCGPKSATMQLVPMSRQLLSYKIVPLVQGCWITPKLRVHDTVFDKVLTVQGTEGIREDRSPTAVSIWIDAES